MRSGKGYVYGTIKTFIPKAFELPKHKGAMVQLINPKAVFGSLHLEYCIISTIKAFSSGKNISKDKGIELLLRVSAQRQVNKALKTIGIKPGDKKAVLIVIGNRAKEIYKKILKQLDAEEINMKEGPIKKQLDAIEKTALMDL